MTTIATYRRYAKATTIALGGAVAADLGAELVLNRGVHERAAMLLAMGAFSAGLAWFITAVAGRLDARNAEALNRAEGNGIETGLGLGLEIVQGGKRDTPAVVRTIGDTRERARRSS